MKIMFQFLFHVLFLRAPTSGEIRAMQIPGQPGGQWSQPGGAHQRQLLHHPGCVPGHLRGRDDEGQAGAGD